MEHYYPMIINVTFVCVLEHCVNKRHIFRLDQRYLSKLLYARVMQEKSTPAFLIHHISIYEAFMLCVYNNTDTHLLLLTNILLQTWNMAARSLLTLFFYNRNNTKKVDFISFFLYWYLSLNTHDKTTTESMRVYDQYTFIQDRSCTHTFD